jgi:Flp pilus assembly protein TadD
MARQEDEALKEARKTIELDPNDPNTRSMLAAVYAARGSYAEAIAEDEKLKQQLPVSQVNSILGVSYALAGRREDALKIIAELKQTAQQQYVSPYDLAGIYAALGDKDQAFAWLEKARDDQSEWMGWLATDFRLDSLHSDPRFADLVRRVGLTN